MKHSAHQSIGEGGLLETLTPSTGAPPADALLENVQRLAGIGTLAAGIAQELANLLSIVTAATNSLRFELQEENNADDAGLRHYMNLIERNVHRSAQIVSLLQDYGTPQLPQMAVTDIDTVLRDTLMLVERQFREEENIEIVVRKPEAPRTMVCDHNRIIQLMIILLNNARSAMPSGGGKIELTTCVVQAGGQPIVPDTLPDAEFDRILIVISDNGSGISDAVQDKMFTPFFSNWTDSNNVGLGLNVARGIVEQHNGKIWFESKSGPDVGATVIVALPVRPPD